LHGEKYQQILHHLSQAFREKDVLMISKSNGQPCQNPRALIDAYGSEKRQETSWKNTEEEEFNWEDLPRQCKLCL